MVIKDLTIKTLGLQRAAYAINTFLKYKLITLTFALVIKLSLIYVTTSVYM